MHEGSVVCEARGRAAVTAACGERRAATIVDRGGATPESARRPVQARTQVRHSCHGMIGRLVRAGRSHGVRGGQEGSEFVVDARLDAPVQGLFEVGRRPPFGAYLREAWRRRTFAFTLAGYRLIGGLLRNRLGILWIVLKPVLTAAIYGTIFGFVLSSSAKPADFVPYILTGVFVFEFFTGSFGGGAKAVTGNAKLVQSLGFPRILLPFSVVAEQAMRMIPVVGENRGGSE